MKAGVTSVQICLLADKPIYRFVNLAQVLSKSQGGTNFRNMMYNKEIFAHTLKPGLCQGQKP